MVETILKIVKSEYKDYYHLLKVRETFLKKTIKNEERNMGKTADIDKFLNSIPRILNNYRDWHWSKNGFFLKALPGNDVQEQLMENRWLNEKPSLALFIV